MISTYACHRTSEKITDADLSAIVEAGGYFLDEHFGPDYGIEPPQVSLWGGRSPLPDGVRRVEFCDLADNEEPSALAWHTEEPDPVTKRPRPVLKIPCNRILAQAGGSVLRGTASISAAFTHELAETERDAPCNEWSDVGDGKTEMALETADPVQNFCFDVPLSDGGAASVSAYVKPPYWDDDSPDDPTGESLCRGVPAGCLTRHHQVADSAPGAGDQGGGYAVARSTGGEQQLGGMVPTLIGNAPRAQAWRAGGAMSGRAARRWVKVAAAQAGALAQGGDFDTSDVTPVDRPPKR